MPSGGPANKSPIPGIAPSVSISAGWMCSCANGASTNRPQMP